LVKSKLLPKQERNVLHLARGS